TNLLKDAKSCKDALETELGVVSSVPAGVTDDLRELNNKLARTIKQLEQAKKGAIDVGHTRRTLNDLEATKLRAVEQFPEIFDPIPYIKVFEPLACMDERFAESQL